jgi:AcrR family transcriptional regulator
VTSSSPPDPRVLRSRHAALTAARELVAEHGFRGVTIEAVAARSGIAKTTIYRQWRSSNDLLVDAFESGKCDVLFPDTGDLRSDLTVGLLALAETLGGNDGGRLLPAMLEAAERDPEFAQLSKSFIEARRKPLRDRITRAVRRGELPADSDVETLTAMLAGPLFYRRLLTHQGLGRAFIERMTHIVIEGSTE